MKKTFLLLVCFAGLLTGHATDHHSDPDSVYLFSYATAKNNNHNGLHFAWSRDRINWFPIGNEFSFLKSDFGRWGSQKKMFTPFLFRSADGMWHCIWSVNEQDHFFAHAASADLIYWGRQSYPVAKQGNTFLHPVVQSNKNDHSYSITFYSTGNRFYRITTKDFKTYDPAVEIPATAYSDPAVTIDLPGGKATGQVYQVAYEVVEKLIKTAELKQYRNALYGETTQSDSQRFARLQPLNATITLQPGKSKPISDMLLGIFFEDINYAADGGLYAELIQNRDFEYKPLDKEGRDQSWNSTHSWTLKGGNSKFSIDSLSPVHIYNPHYAVLTTTTPGAALVNSGFDRIALKKGEKYNFSAFVKTTGKGKKLKVSLVSPKQGLIASTNMNASSSSWKMINATLIASVDADDAQLEIQPLSIGQLSLDMVSLFPEKTFKERKNGLRADLAQVIADLHPRFVRFPGGCVAHGDGLGNIYRWKNTIGPLESRVPQRNIWNYHQTAGLGYFEYFQFCEDIGAEPLPVIAAGVPCQNSGVGGHGQQGGIPMNEMDEYTQDILDLIEWANGDVTTTWGKKRAEAGHPKPFNLKYIGIGNEDLISDVFEERFTMIYNEVRKKHPEITIIGTVGPFWEGTDYTEGWKLANKLEVPVVDEHYYQPPAWFIYNQDFYDKYDRNRSKVYLGEYAAHLPGRPSNLETALSEALYLTGLERNGDIVTMSSYAPLLAKEGHTQWTPDLIYFNNTTVKPTVDYYVQQLYGLHAGDQYLLSNMTISPQGALWANSQEAVRNRVAYSIVRDSKTNDVIVKLVNMLPVAVTTALELDGLNIADAQGTKTVMQGAPTDKTIKPVTSAFSVSNNFTEQLSPYSFTVIRIKTK